MRRLTLIAILLVGLAFTLTACGGSDDPDTAPVSTVEAGSALTLSGTSSQLDLDPITSGVLSGAGVTVEAAEPATGAGKKFDVPVIGGKLTSGTLAGTIEHEGGITFVAGDKRVKYSDLKVDTVSEQVFTGDKGTTPVFDLDFGDLQRSDDGGTIVLKQIVATLGIEAARELNAGLEVSAFVPRQVIGKITVRATGQ